MRKLAALVGATAALVAAFIATFVSWAAPLAQPEPQILTMYVGQGTGMIAQQDFIGDPNIGGNTVRVVQGTTVRWLPLGEEPHTVTFPADQSIPDIFVSQPEDPGRPPMFNPRVFFPSLPTGPYDGTTYISAELPTDLRDLPITFTRLGRHPFLCLYHVNMTGTVEVVAPGTPGVTTQAAVDAQQIAMDAMRQNQAGGILASRGAATRVEGPRGADLWFVRAGTNRRDGNLDIQAFLPNDVVISQGDTVVWYADNVQHHTVTFRPIGVPNASADLFQVQMADGATLPRSSIGPEVISWFEDPINPARLVFGPGARRTTNAIHDGRNLFTSGVIGEHPRIGVPLEKVWALTFNTPGSFQYACLIREDQGMTGNVTVRAR